MSNGVVNSVWEPSPRRNSDYEASQSAVAQLAHALRACELLHRNLDLTQVFESVVQGAVDLGYRRAVLNVRDPESGTLKPVSFAGLLPAEIERLQTSHYSLEEVKPLLEERFRISQSYFVREGEVDWSAVLGDRFVPAVERGNPCDESWHPEDALIVPLLGTDDALLGMLSLDDPANQLRPREDGVRLIEAYTNQAAIAMVNATLLERLQEQLLDSALTENALRESEGRYRTIFEASADAIFVLDKEWRITVANPAAGLMCGCDKDELVGSPIDLFLNVTHTEKKRMIKNASGQGGPLGRRSTGIRRDGTPFDVELQAATISLDQKRHILLVVKDISQRVLAERRAAQANERIRSLHDAALRLAACESEDEICKLTVAVGETVLSHDFCALYLATDGRLTLGACSGDPEPAGSALPLSYSSCVVSAFHTMKPVIVHESGQSMPYGTSQSAHISALAVPAGRVAALYIASRKPRTFSEEDIRTVELLAGHVAEAIRRLRLQEKLRSQAMLDPLTGVYNRRYFNEVIEQEITRSERYKHSVAFLMIDINRFKEVNDLLGHQVGDLVLRDIAMLLRDSVREVDWVVRYGGDEFLIVLPETADRLESVRTRLEEAMVAWSDQTALVDFPLTLAVGWAEWSPLLPRPLEQVLAEADRKMYDDKVRCYRARETKLG
ncbi:diguanylate cyclase [Candidatus Bipolaricaulota bacterium]|nr:diguanylate cyclase [Candidatus Bipolaricaulota bacterium]